LRSTPHGATVKILTAYSLIRSFVPRLPAQPATSSICVTPVSSERPKVISPGDDYNTATLLSKIDRRAAIPWPYEEIANIQDLDLNDRHLIIVNLGWKTNQVFLVSFFRLQNAVNYASGSTDIRESI
jgi:hypothetical protein